MKGDWIPPTSSKIRMHVKPFTSHLDMLFAILASAPKCSALHLLMTSSTSCTAYTIYLQQHAPSISNLLLFRVTIKGLPDEEAVLCTWKGTYSVKHVDTTNSLFLVPPVKDSSCEKVTVAATAVAHLELVLTAPRLGALERILQVMSRKVPWHPHA